MGNSKAKKQKEESKNQNADVQLRLSNQQQENFSSVKGSEAKNNIDTPIEDTKFGDPKQSLQQEFSQINPNNSNFIETKVISPSSMISGKNTLTHLPFSEVKQKSQNQLPESDKDDTDLIKFSKINNEIVESDVLQKGNILSSNIINPESQFYIKDKRIMLPIQIKENYDFQQFKVLGSGAFGCVFQARNIRTGNFHAIKRMEFINSADLFNITKEINILYRLLPYGNIVNFKQNYSDIANSAMYIAMEKGDHSLEEYISRNENGVIPSKILHQIMIDIIFALVYSYRESVVHSDIKPGNIIVFENSQKRSELSNVHSSKTSEENLIFKLNDFGSGTLKISKNDLRLQDHMSYTVLYAAPEVKKAEAEEEDEEKLDYKKIDEKQKYLNYEKADIFSFGMTLLNCCGLGKDVLAKLNRVENEDEFEQEIKRIMDIISKKKEYSAELLKVIQGMIKYKKEERFDLKYICKNMGLEVPEVIYSEKKREMRQIQKAYDEKLPDLPPPHIARPIDYDFEPIYELIKKKLNEINKLPLYDHKILERIHKRNNEMSPQKYTPVWVVLKYLDSNEIYYGGFEEGLRHLSGLQIFPDGSIYQGNFRRDNASGQGTKIFSNGDIFDGYFLNGLIEGGTLLYSDGRKYIGLFKNDLPDGEGAEIFPDDTIFEGYFENGLKNGIGLLKMGEDTFKVDYEKGELKRRLSKWEEGLSSVVILKK